MRNDELHRAFCHDQFCRRCQVLDPANRIQREPSGRFAIPEAKPTACECGGPAYAWFAGETWGVSCQWCACAVVKCENCDGTAIMAEWTARVAEVNAEWSAADDRLVRICDLNTNYPMG